MAPLLCLLPYAVLKDYPHHLTKYEGKGGTKILFFKILSELGGRFESAIYAVQKSQFRVSFMNWRPNLKSVDELGKAMSSV